VQEHPSRNPQRRHPRRRPLHQQPQHHRRHLRPPSRPRNRPSHRRHPLRHPIPLRPPSLHRRQESLRLRRPAQPHPPGLHHRLFPARPLHRGRLHRLQGLHRPQRHSRVRVRLRSHLLRVLLLSSQRQPRAQHHRRLPGRYLHR
jgi:hypothetical protein